jgi:hypothetical protein
MEYLFQKIAPSISIINDETKASIHSFAHSLFALLMNQYFLLVAFLLMAEPPLRGWNKRAELSAVNVTRFSGFSVNYFFLLGFVCANIAAPKAKCRLKTTKLIHSCT